MFTADDHLYMARALRLAARGLYTTDPNPRVGCVLVRDGQVVGEGWHERARDAHAEINAMRQSGERAAGATAYVTLEPCCHHGRTPPCSQALLAAGVSRVVAAMPDPNPQVAGNGLAELQAAGVTTDAGLLATEAQALNPGFVMRMRDPHIGVDIRIRLNTNLLALGHESIEGRFRFKGFGAILKINAPAGRAGCRGARGGRRRRASDRFLDRRLARGGGDAGRRPPSLGRGCRWPVGRLATGPPASR